MLDTREVYKALHNIAKSGLTDTPVEDIVTVAIAVWHEGFAPDIKWAETLDPKGQLIIGYTIEFLAGFNVLCKEERQKLLLFSGRLKPSNPPQVKPDDQRDTLATQWGLEKDLTSYFEYISDFQTRHYKHESEYKRPSPNFVL